MRTLNKKVGVTLLVGALLLGSTMLHARKPILPGVGVPITLKALFNEINANNPQKNSDFLVFTGNNWKSANLKGWINDTNNPQNGQVTVILAQDPAQIALLRQPSVGHLDTPTAMLYQKYLLFFTLNGQKVYINNPWPGKLVINRSSKATAKNIYTRNPARDIMTKWQNWDKEDKKTFDSALASAYPTAATKTTTSKRGK